MKKFDVLVVYQGYSSAFEEKLFKTAEPIIGEHGYSDGSGIGPDGRDHAWYNLSESKAKKLKKVFEDLSKSSGRELTITLRETK